MRKLINPTDVARETFKQLAVRRIPPTPDHYEEIYHGIAGTPEEERIPPLAKQLEDTLSSLPRQSPELSRSLDQLRRCIRASNWEKVTELAIRCVELQGGQTQLARGWAELIRDLVKQWDLRNPNYTAARKQDALERVLINFGGDPSSLNEKLDGLVRAWGETGTPSDGLGEADEAVQPASSIAPMALDPAAPGGPAGWAEWRESLSHALDLQKFMPRLKKFWIRLELSNSQETRLCDGLLSLLRLLTDNIGEIIVDETWVRGQIAVVQEIMAQPLDMRLIYDAEAGIKEVIYKQSVLKQGLREAQAALKSMMSTFIDRLGTISDSTDQYQQRITTYSEQISRSNNLSDLKVVLENLTHDTRSMQLDVVRSRDELVEARTRVNEAQTRIDELEKELQAVSEKVREDQLTGAMNRRGLDETLTVEAARALRSGKPLGLALLDIDNFKKLNDVRGHSAGDQALIHLVAVVKSLLRPTDKIARYGGEEFVLLLPETDLRESEAAMLRLQRELTRRFFLHNNDKVLITFSAGVTLLAPGEIGHEAIDRADAAMYRAKQAGKNRVEVEVPPDTVASPG